MEESSSSPTHTPRGIIADMGRSNDIERISRERGSGKYVIGAPIRRHLENNTFERGASFYWRHRARVVEFREVEGKLRIRGGHQVFWENSGD